MATPRSALARSVAALDSLPEALRSRLVTFGFTRKVRFAGTASIAFETLAQDRAVLHLENRRKVQNHIGGIHAAAMALLAETATGAVLGMNLPDEQLPLFKSMHIDYVRRAQGDLRAEAALTPEMRQRIATEPKGDLMVPVKVTDSAGEEPIKCQMTWAWVPKKK
jgi:acyl-coenzyme A thioesterase PaaI-like protein